MRSEIGHHITITGPHGEIQWGYHVAARLVNWSLTDSELHADVVELDPLRIVQSALTFVVLRPSGHSWTWPVEELSITESNRLLARLGPQEKVH